MESGLSMRLRKNKAKANVLRISLDTSADTYTMCFYSVKREKMEAVTVRRFVYAGDLEATFTEVTGLYTSLSDRAREE